MTFFNLKNSNKECDQEAFSAQSIEITDSKLNYYIETEAKLF
jgi:hypothetical protein